jgi:hypothetical protein
MVFDLNASKAIGNLTPVAAFDGGIIGHRLRTFRTSVM